MTVVHFDAARYKLRSELPHRWQAEERAELMRLCVVLDERGDTTGYEYGETESGEPQFYVLGPDLRQNCVVCISRISKDSRPWYVIEDGLGGIVAEGCSLNILVSKVTKRALRSNLLLVASIFDHFSRCTGDVFGQDRLVDTIITWAGVA